MILWISNSCKGGVKEELSPEREKIYFGNFKELTFNLSLCPSNYPSVSTDRIKT